MQPKAEDAFDRAEREAEERQGAARSLSNMVFGPDESGAGETDAQKPAASVDAGEHGIKPEERKAPAEHLADMLLRGEGVPADAWRRGL